MVYQTKVKMITAIIPAYNEARRIKLVLEQTKNFVNEIIVVDDNSQDDTAEIAKKYGKVIRNERKRGYIYSIKKGFKEAKNEIIVTIDGDGEHDPTDIPRLVKPIIDDEADLVLGGREKIPRPSERIINFLTNFRVDTKDCGTGFRAIKKDLAQKLQLKGECTCGIFVLEAKFYGARIKNVNIKTRTINKKKEIALKHFKQMFIVLKWLVSNKN